MIERVVEWFVSRVVGPHGKDATWHEVAREPPQAFAFIEGLVARMEQVSRGVIDVEKDGVEFLAGVFRIESVGVDRREEICVDEAAALIGAKLRAQWDQSAMMPIDHRLQRIDDGQGSHGWVLECRARRVA